MTEVELNRMLTILYYYAISDIRPKFDLFQIEDDVFIYYPIDSL